jgi:hypothetical protein
MENTTIIHKDIKDMVKNMLLPTITLLGIIVKYMS